MKTLKKILKENQTLFIQMSLVILCFGLAGMVLHDLIVTFVPDEDMTVVPLGTTFLLMGIFILSMFYFVSHGSIHFNLAVSMGGTRKQFFYEQITLLTGFYAVWIAFAYVFHRFELWTIEILFKGAYELEFTCDELFQWKIIFFAILMGVTLNMLLIAMGLKFGRYAYIVLYLVYMVFLLCIKKIEAYFEKINFVMPDIVRNSTFVICLILAIAIGLLVTSRLIIRRQQVTL